MTPFSVVAAVRVVWNVDATRPPFVAPCTVPGWVDVDSAAVGAGAPPLTADAGIVVPEVPLLPDPPVAGGVPTRVTTTVFLGKPVDVVPGLVAAAAAEVGACAAEVGACAAADEPGPAEVVPAACAVGATGCAVTFIVASTTDVIWRLTSKASSSRCERGEDDLARVINVVGTLLLVTDDTSRPDMAAYAIRKLASMIIK